METVSNYSNVFAGLPLWVIGRGASLARLSAGDIGRGPVVAINQAIEQVETLNLSNPLFSMQKDRYFCKPRAARVLAHKHESYAWSGAVLERDGALLFDCESDFGYPWNVPSVVACVGLAKLWNCSRVVFLCCDATTDGDTRAFGVPPTYPANYLMHGALVQRYAQLPVEYKRL
jgi:hypothetical protein